MVDEAGAPIGGFSFDVLSYVQLLKYPIFRSSVLYQKFYILMPSLQGV